MYCFNLEHACCCIEVQMLHVYKVHHINYSSGIFSFSCIWYPLSLFLYLDDFQLEGSSEYPCMVTQYHFTSWPDHDVPEYATSILTYHRRITKDHKPSKGPMVVHCRWVGLHFLHCNWINLSPVLVWVAQEHSLLLTLSWNRWSRRRWWM